MKATKLGQSIHEPHMVKVRLEPEFYEEYVGLSNIVGFVRYDTVVRNLESLEIDVWINTENGDVRVDGAWT